MSSSSPLSGPHSPSAPVAIDCDGKSFTCSSDMLGQAAGLHAVHGNYVFGDVHISESDPQNLLATFVRSGVVISDGKGGIKSNGLTGPVATRAVSQYFNRQAGDKRKLTALRQKLGIPDDAHAHGHGDDHGEHAHGHTHDHHHGPAYEKNDAILERRLEKLKASGWSPHGENGLGNIGVKAKASVDWARSWIPLPVIGLGTTRKAQYEVHGHHRGPAQINPESFRIATAHINLEGNSPHSPIMNGMLGARHWAQKWDSLRKRWNSNNEIHASVGPLRIKCKGDRYTMAGYVGHYPHTKLITITVRNYDDLYMAGLAAGIIQPDENFFTGPNSQKEAFGMINYMSMSIWRKRIQEMSTQVAFAQTYAQSTGNPVHLTYHEIFEISKSVREKIENYTTTAQDRLLSPNDFAEAVLTNSGAYSVIDSMAQSKEKADAQKSWLRYFLSESVGDNADVWIGEKGAHDDLPPRLQAPLDGDKRWNYWDYYNDINKRMHEGSLDIEEGDILAGLIGHLSVLDKKSSINTGSLVFIGGIGRYAKGTIMLFEHGIKMIPESCTMSERRTKFQNTQITPWKDVAHGVTTFLQDELHIQDTDGLGYIAGQVGHLQGKIKGVETGKRLLVDVLQNEAAALFRHRLSPEIMNNVLNGSSLYGWWDGNGLGGINRETTKLIIERIEGRINGRPINDTMRNKIVNDIVEILIRRDAFHNNSRPNGSGGITVAQGADLLKANITGFVDTYITDDFIL